VVNKVILLGNLGADPELKSTPSGQSVCSLRIATSEKYKDKDGNQQEKTEWHKVVVWGKLADLVNQFCKKGKQIYLEGKLQTRKWQDKDGKDQYTTEVVAENVKFLGGAGGGASNEEGGGNSNRGGYGAGGGASSNRGGQSAGNGGGGGYGRQSAPSRPAPVDDTGFAGGSDDDIPF